MRSSTHREEAHIKLFKKAELWRFEIECGNYKLAGNGKSFNDVEIQAYKALKVIPNHGTIHLYYPEGKLIDVAKIPMKDVMGDVKK
jgi:hypothetical protein